jgi:hypothetical protein
MPLSLSQTCNTTIRPEAASRSSLNMSLGEGQVSVGLLLLSLALSGFGADLFVVLLQGCQVLAGLAELTLLHALTHVPVDECALCVHQVELVVQTGEHLKQTWACC